MVFGNALRLMDLFFFRFKILNKGSIEWGH